MFTKFFASIGIGSTQADLQLKQNKLTMGQKAIGSLNLIVGKVEQEMESLAVHLYVKYKYYSRRKDYTDRFQDLVTTIPIQNKNFIIKPEQNLQFPFSFDCPDHLAI